MNARLRKCAPVFGGMAVALAGCSTIPPERAERDRAILAAVQPCKERHAERLYNADMMSVNQNGTVRFWYKDGQASAVDDINRCISEATKGLRLGPWLRGRAVKTGPTSVSMSAVGGDLVVPVRVNGILGTMAVRRNVDFTYVTTAYAKRAGLQTFAESPTIRIRRGSESMLVPFARVRALEVGEAQVEALDVVVYEPEPNALAADGILGRSFLHNFEMAMDRGAGRLTLAPYVPKGGSSP